ncbi:hypothetical protein [Lacrimispora indolis]|uniref:hypothetical protein n=1 Tax=Lacrimispora indolis TaxID=69825 RepID=UPI00041D8AFB|nr:hypothetical protein [[Clostridium] methoxybenzovorans]
MTERLEPCKCPKCGKENNYIIVMSYNSFSNIISFPRNVCDCGNQLEEGDILYDKASPFHRSCVRTNKIMNEVKSFLKDEKDNWHCENCGNNKSSGRGFCYVKKPEKYVNDNTVEIEKSFKICEKCGHETLDSYEDYKDLYILIEKLDDGSLLLKRRNNYDDILSKIQSENDRIESIAENNLIAKGEITSLEEEQEYKERYYKTNYDQL